VLVHYYLNGEMRWMTSLAAKVMDNENKRYSKHLLQFGNQLISAREAGRRLGMSTRSVIGRVRTGRPITAIKYYNIRKSA
jgi:hypothetical protein